MPFKCRANPGFSEQTGRAHPGFSDQSGIDIYSIVNGDKRRRDSSAAIIATTTEMEWKKGKVGKGKEMGMNEAVDSPDFFISGYDAAHKKTTRIHGQTIIATIKRVKPVSYTHLTLPTNREV